MTKKLLNALLRLGTLPSADQNDCAWIKVVAALARLCDTFAAKAALILKIIRVDVGHTI